MQWYVCTTTINGEFMADAGLKAKGFTSYCPTGKKMVRHARRQSLRLFPIFSRYIFVQFDIKNPDYSEPIRSTDGIVDIISNNWQPVSVPTWAIDDIQEREKAGEF